MLENAPGWLVAWEASSAGAAIRQSVWIYPTANVLHVVGLAAFSGAVAVLDLSILASRRIGGAAVKVIVPAAQRWAKVGLAVMIGSGLVLFTAEASHVAMNWVFQLKLVLIVTGIANALLAGGVIDRALADLPAEGSLPSGVRRAALASLAIWLMVAALGRMIAYF